jgi:23S rRNA (adenine2503-C2)-methyltransferase
MTIAADNLWSQALADRLPRKVVWRLVRQFQSPAEACCDQVDGPALAEQLAAALSWSVVRRRNEAYSTKLLLSNAAGIRCEAVALFPDGRQPSDAPAVTRSKRAAVCISSQPGCGVGCPFCSTGELGFRGNLTAAEIVEQVYWAGTEARRRGRLLKNVVFMGMGEPLHNRQAVFQAIEWLTADRLFALPPRRLTVSTAGVPGAMLELACRFPQVRLALSLHSADPDLRRQLVPRAVANLDILRDCIRELNALQPNQSLWLEVVLFSEVNDTPEHALQLIEFCKDLRVEINLIPYNIAANSDRFRPSPLAAREAFATILRHAGLRASFRTSFGQGSNAACGQLQANTSPATH